MTNQGGHAESGHTPVSNAPTELDEVAVTEEEVSQPPFEGEGFARLQETVQRDLEGVEAVPGYGQMRAALTNSLVDPNVVLAAPETIDLPPIAEASFGPLISGRPSIAEVPSGSLAVRETVHDTDDRVQIADTSTYPWRAHASLLITAADNTQWIGTAWFIGPRTLATAGHCVFINEPGTPAHGWVRSIQVMPGRNGSTLPYGSVTSTDFRSVNGWTENGDENYDYGAIIIPTELGTTVGWLGIGVYPDSTLLASTVNIAGYPGDKPRGTQWFQARQVASVNPMKVFYDIDTAGGQSGTAVFRVVNDERYATAIHAYGGPVTNSGTRISRSVYDNLLAWNV
jgi:glutamyl endopeptidase